MKTFVKGVSNKIYLDQTGLASGKTVKLTIVGENGDYLTDSTGALLKDLSCSFDNTAGVMKYYYNVTFNNSWGKQYIRLYFSSADVVIDPNYYPDDAYCDDGAINLASEIVPYGYFKEFFMDIRTAMDFDHQQIVTQYLTDRKGLQSKLQAAQNDLEMELEIYITPREKTEKRDNYLENLSQHFWQFPVSYPPIIELKKFKLKIGSYDLVDIPQNLFTVNEQMGVVEFLPFPTQNTAGYFSYLLYGASGLAATSIYTVGGYERIPNMFWCQYTCGLWRDGADKTEKESIRNIIAQKALMKILDLTDIKRTTTQAGESIDGAQANESYKMDILFKEWKEEEKAWVYNLKKRYGKLVNAGVL